MIALRDKNKDVWSWVCLDKDWHVCYEDKTCEPIQPHHLYFERGKYAGEPVANVDDEWYWGFLRKKAEEDGDVWLARCVKLMGNK